MGYSAVYRKAAIKYIEKQPRKIQSQIMDAVDALPHGNVIKLQGRSGYRLTIGSYRVLFEYTDEVDEDGLQVIDVFLIGPRGDVYKK